MTYDYAKERPELFTEDGQRVLLAVRDAAFDLISTAGAVRAAEVMDVAVKRLGAASSWTMLAALDRLVEIKDLVQVYDGGWAQHRVFCRRTS